MRARLRALLRLLAVQGSWSYERMTGTGVGYAALPLIEEAVATGKVTDERSAVARASDYFNSHPYLASVAVGATMKAELDGVPAEGIRRLRAALSGPLGAIGDQLFWAGLVPIVAAAGLLLVPWLGWWPPIILVAGYNAIRWWLGQWGLRVGLRDGVKVGATLRDSRLPAAAALAQDVALVAVGAAVPVALWWMSGHLAGRVPAMAVAAALGVALVMIPATRTRVNGLRFGLLLVLIVLLAMGVS